QSTPRRSEVVVLLLPRGLQLDDLLPVAGRDIGNVGLGGDRGAPANRVADQRLIFGADRQLGVAAERCGGGESAQWFGQFGAVGRICPLGRRGEEVDCRRILPRPIGRILVGLSAVGVGPGRVLRRL